MAEEAQQQDSSKTLVAFVAFVVGLLIGGMLVWAFSGPNADAPPSLESRRLSYYCVASSFT